jgi:hypothetical protein
MLRGLDASLATNSLGISTYGLTCTSLEDVFVRICEGVMPLNGQTVISSEPASSWPCEGVMPPNGQSLNQPSLNGMQGAKDAAVPHAEGDGAGGGAASWAGGIVLVGLFIALLGLFTGGDGGLHRWAA